MEPTIFEPWLKFFKFGLWLYSVYYLDALLFKRLKPHFPVTTFLLPVFLRNFFLVTFLHSEVIKGVPVITSCLFILTLFRTNLSNQFMDPHFTPMGRACVKASPRINAFNLPDTKRTLKHLFVCTNSAQRDLVSICTQSIRNCN